MKPYKTILFSTLLSVSALTHADITIAPINFDAGQGNYLVTMTGKVTVMGMSINVPASEIKNVVKPASEAAFCNTVRNQDYQDVDMNIRTCTFDGNKGKLSGDMLVGGTKSRFEYNYTFSN